MISSIFGNRGIASSAAAASAAPAGEGIGAVNPMREMGADPIAMLNSQRIVKKGAPEIEAAIKGMIDNHVRSISNSSPYRIALTQFLRKKCEGKSLADLAPNIANAASICVREEIPRQKEAMDMAIVNAAGTVVFPGSFELTEGEAVTNLKLSFLQKASDLSSILFDIRDAWKENIEIKNGTRTVKASHAARISVGCKSELETRGGRRKTKKQSSKKRVTLRRRKVSRNVH
jgi:hypothetical protein